MTAVHGPRIVDGNEWLEADGLGGFASGTLTGIRTRRYHALLLTARTPPTGRVVLVNGLDAWVETDAGAYALTSQRYLPDVIHPDGASRVVRFALAPWPQWVLRLDDGDEIVHEVFARNGTGIIACTWRTRVRPPNRSHIRLIIRPFLSGRDFHATHHENGVLRFDARQAAGRVEWQPYDMLPRIVAHHNGSYVHSPYWYRDFLYAEDQARGLDFTEDLASPGTLSFDLAAGDAVLLFEAVMPGRDSAMNADAVTWLRRARTSELRRRTRFPSRLQRSADAYIVRRGGGRSIIAGYPWFSDWGRDTFVAVRGLCIAGDRIADAKAILLEWADAISEGMLPNRFVEQGEPEFNAVDAALWYTIAVHGLLQAVGADRRRLLVRERRRLQDAVLAILEGHARGTRHGIRVDTDGLLAAGEPGVQLTWMDARVGERVVTPRTGKPVEIQALWLNALALGARFDTKWNTTLQRGLAAFAQRFWNADAGCLYDVVDVDHVTGAVDAACRPNQIFAVGGLPLALLEGEQARRVVDVVETRLLTPLGLRTLAPGEPGYTSHYEGGVPQRDGAYHQGTVWPWLMGAFVEAWLRVRGDDAVARDEAKRRFMAPLLAHLDGAGIGHVSEVADAESPHTPRGCPFQAWSMGELLRLHARLM